MFFLYDVAHGTTSQVYVPSSPPGQAWGVNDNAVVAGFGTYVICDLSDGLYFTPNP
jgi:hypothetical protein